MCQLRKTLRENLQFCLYRGVSAINFTAEPTAQDAISSTFVLSVTEHIVPLTVIFAVQPKNLPMNDRPSLFRPPLPTAVKMSKLKLLLDGYEPHLVDNLMFGFLFVFLFE
jgi:hypothetical protein